MFIPYRDVNPSGTIPYVTVGLIMANVLVFLAEVTSPNASAWFADYGLTPREFITAWRTGGVFRHALMPMFTNLFVHAGWLHLAANMIYLWVFVDNIEDRLGHAEFLVFDLICGIISSLAHVIFVPGSTAPLVGASGAISGVLGAYLVCFPRARVWVLVVYKPVEMAALWFLGIWFGTAASARDWRNERQGPRRSSLHGAHRRVRDRRGPGPALPREGRVPGQVRRGRNGFVT